MAVSIFHRLTGDGMAIAGAIALVWWLTAAASGPEAYADFTAIATSWFGIAVGVGLSWAFFQHMFGGIRHFVLDTGAGYELRTNKLWSVAIFALSFTATALFWVIVAMKG